jgi:VIT1/CCC1 family predicted Fe2+/Mn2+ transporter
MMSMELGLSESTGLPWKHASATFFAFVLAGLVPLIPYLYCNGGACFAISAAAAGVALFITGALRTLITGVSWLIGGLEMLGVGAAAAAVAYGVGQLIAAVV